MQKYFANKLKYFLLMTNIGNNIKKLRKVKGLSQQAFAELFDLTRGNISSYEEMRAEPRIETILRIAKYFGIPIQALIQDNLSVNQILNFNDHFEQTIVTNSTKNLATIPFLSREDLLSDESVLVQLDKANVIQLPIQSKQRFIAIEFSELLPNPVDFICKEHSILIFEALVLESLHLLDSHFGLFLSEKEFFMGTYSQSESKIDLVLNDWKSQKFAVEEIKYFWKLYAKLEKI